MRMRDGLRVAMGLIPTPGFDEVSLGFKDDGKLYKKNASGVETLIEGGTTSAAFVNDTGWITPTMQNGWTQYPDGWEPVGYRKVGNIVFLRGLIQQGTTTTNTTFFTLPVDFRPSGDSHIPVTTAANNAARINVFRDGRVTCNTGISATWTSLSNISFPVDGGVPLQSISPAIMRLTEGATQQNANSWTLITGLANQTSRGSGLTKTFDGGIQIDKSGWYRVEAGVKFDTVNLARSLCRVSYSTNPDVNVVLNSEIGGTSGGYPGHHPSTTLFLEAGSIVRLHVYASATVTSSGKSLTVTSLDGGNIDAETDSGWLPFPGSGNIGAYNDGFQTPQYRKIGNKVTLRGLLKPAAAIGVGFNLGTLPLGYRTIGGTLIFMTYTGNGPTRIDVDTSGTVRIQSGANQAAGGYISLDGIEYYAD